MKYDNQLRLAKSIVATYDGKLPLAAWLKQYFREHKQAGSRDRRILSSLVYSYYRLGHHPFANIDDRLKAAMSISPDLGELQNYFGASNFEIDVEAIFPFSDLSDGINAHDFAQSFLHQPDLFIRLRPGYEQKVQNALIKAGIQFHTCSPSCLRLPNSTKMEGLLHINREAVIQDKSSQETGGLLLQAREVLGDGNLQIWDCCAASGGKSIMALDLLKDVSITVSDKRSTIIRNLRERFMEADIKRYDYFIADIASSEFELPRKKFDIIIVDAPCSGSGTWSRTPEQLYFFSREKIEHYRSLQVAITSSVIEALKPGGLMIYLTCSVFRRENEEVLESIEKNGLTEISRRLFAGYNERADTLFGAVFRS